MADLTVSVIPNILSGLLATSTADLDAFWTMDQLYAFADEELKRLARSAGVWVDRQPVTFTAREGFVPCPAGHLGAHMADLNGLVLRNNSIQQLQAMDSDWYNSQRPSTAFTIGADGADTIRLYGLPGMKSIVNLIFQAECSTVNNALTSTPLSPLLDDVLALRAIAEARRAETDAQMPEATAFCEQLIGLYHQVAANYFGGGI